MPARTGPRPVADTLVVDTILQVMRQTQLTTSGAERVVGVLTDKGLVEFAVMRGGPCAEGFVPFLERLWNYRDSPYAQEKLRAHQRIGKGHCYDMRTRVRVYWKACFKDQRLAEIRREDLRAFAFWLEGEKGLQPKTCNNVLSAGTTERTDFPPDLSFMPPGPRHR